MRDYKSFVKYSKAGPRYTSYPTAIEFSTNFKYEKYIELLKKQDRDLSLYFHLPFCRSACYFCGCNVIYTAKEENKERYLSYIFKELDLLSKIINTKRKVIQMHFGGGTPTFFSAKQLERLILKIKEKFINLDERAEISCEIDPRFLNEEQASVLTKHGFNRISFGVQDFDERVQKEIHRIQPFELTQNVVNLVRSKGIKSVNIDLIYGLPYQSLESFEKTLEKALIINPDRFAIFNYAHVPWLKKNMRKFNESTIPSPDIKLAILEYCEKFLTQNDYKMIGMDHFAKADDELFKALENGTLHRNFQGYTTKGGADLIGVGLTSIGEGVNHYAQNFKDMPSYERAIDNDCLPFEKGILLNNDDMLRKAVIMSLMANFALNIKDIEKEFNIDFFEYFNDDLKELQEYKNFLSIDKNSIKVNETGVLLIRNIAMCFDAYYKKISEDKKVFSKTV
ncbi:MULTISPECIES: oxygen-independent coproporphyrinogen III oxidase [unclassified Campylobacter]|uniref:oxygen-independent coproporphyrinogen III oxidase n=1 Tax=unclassified Campylobacter TaxID=2593542 RepID=UPI0012381CA6|nr:MULTISPECIES: oxygen-independent coproporphyrinogen III oxidase [unclassified Campylobacter]KAA6226722.1 oxygen-independent coproporphyrinogen III oxidase [Campylobacter sp. LR196d]KAA6228682.1 oxygen-independent coproporphyrinogen III oxidase [Campylobacter sp. LR185c]KAA6229085.1 oxygen-independent coproporphyrinogen III oxidase [Campylobacter sp. LR286c]KAA6230159.1 oxygen-independent coproporphyrinogen III oxidase [Campylobacter sp. LR291e]KAA6233680.1 oxygen-independent coproporphyrino